VITPGQDFVLKQLNKEIILVPDRDHAGPKTVAMAIEYGWSVSMPEWPDGVKDVNDAIVKLGRLATLWLIIHAKETYDVKIKVKSKLWFKKQ
jgi:DNA primase